jgi:hypothetical protein
LDGTRNRSLQNEAVCGAFGLSEMPKRKFWVKGLALHLQTR